MRGDDVLPLTVVFAELSARTYHKKIEPLLSQTRVGYGTSRLRERPSAIRPQSKAPDAAMS